MCGCQSSSSGLSGQVAGQLLWLSSVGQTACRQMHDISAEQAADASLVASKVQGQTECLPLFCDKAGHDGRRLQETTPPQRFLSLQCDPDLVTVNARLPAYQEALDAQVDAWLIIRVPDPTCVYKWRLEAEEKQKARGKPGMTEEQVHDFVDRSG